MHATDVIAEAIIICYIKLIMLLKRSRLYQVDWGQLAGLAGSGMIVGMGEEHGSLAGRRPGAELRSAQDAFALRVQQSTGH